MNYGITQHSQPGTRSINQDRAAYAERDNALLIAVADGLGGYLAGEMAAQTVVDTLIDSFHNVRSTVISKQRGITANFPRTTCVACLIQNGYGYWAHVGDSRLYHFRDNQFLSRTIDHSTTDPMYQEGILDEKKSMQEAGRLIRCVGGPKRPLVTFGAETRLAKGDVLLLCTDGVWRAFTDIEMEKVLGSRDLEDGIERIMAKSAQTFRKDCDNLTAVGLTWNEEPSTSPPLFALSVPEVDQKLLWRYAKQRSGARDDAPCDDVSAQERKTHELDSVDATITEIESFVNDLERLL